jgi:hypothetical protein
VAVEGAGGGKLAELVADHVLADEDGHELAAIVDRKREADRLGHDGGATGPGLDGRLHLGGAHLGDLGGEVAVHERPLLD